MSLNFEYILMLALLVLVPVMIVFYYLYVRKKRNSARLMGDPELVQELIGNYSPGKNRFKFFLLTTALALLIVSLANLRTPSGKQQINRSGLDVVVALDVSRSMLAADLQPNRLDRAKLFLSRTFDKLSNHRIGLVIFAGKAYVQMPVSSDINAAKMYLNTASSEAIPTQGTVIADALRMSDALFNPDEKKYKSIILVTDGEDHDEEAEKVARDISKNGVVINTVGIGSIEGTAIRNSATGDYMVDGEGKMVVTKLNEKLLQDIAKAGQGFYQQYTGTDEVVSKLSAFMSSMDQRPIRDDSMMNWQSLFQILSGLALLLLIADLFVSEIKKARKEKRGALKVAAALALVGMVSPAFAQTQNRQAIKEGNDFFEQRNYPAAAGAYQKAINDDPNDATALFNLGNAYYKGGKKEDALSIYDRAARTFAKADDVAKALYNKGVVQQNMEKLDECISTYKTVLRINPADADARHNLQLALQKKKQQQQNQNQNNQNNQNSPQQPRSSEKKQQDAENKLNALAQHERNLQDKLRKTTAQSPDQPEKNW